MPDRSTLPLNGFLSSQHFDLLATCVQDPTKDDPEPTVSLLLESNSETRAVFPHDFVLAYHVTLMNADDEEWRSLKKLKSEDVRSCCLSYLLFANIIPSFACQMVKD